MPIAATELELSPHFINCSTNRSFHLSHNNLGIYNKIVVLIYISFWVCFTLHCYKFILLDFNILPWFVFLLINWGINLGLEVSPSWTRNPGTLSCDFTSFESTFVLKNEPKLGRAMLTKINCHLKEKFSIVSYIQPNFDNLN